MADIQNEGLWEEIRYFRLRNKGAFVARMHVICSVRDGKIVKRVELERSWPSGHFGGGGAHCGLG